LRAGDTDRSTLRRPARIKRRVSSQLCCLLLGLAVISIPLNGMAAQRASSLIPLRTHFVPFDTAIQAPDLTVAQYTAGVPSDRRITLAWNQNSLPIPDNRNFVRCGVFDSSCHSGADILLRGRSPPAARECLTLTSTLSSPIRQSSLRLVPPHTRLIVFPARNYPAGLISSSGRTIKSTALAIWVRDPMAETILQQGSHR